MSSHVILLELLPRSALGQSGPDPGPLSLPADDGRHVLFERGDALLQALREVLQQTTLLVHKQPEAQQVRVLLHTHKYHTHIRGLRIVTGGELEFLKGSYFMK